MIASTELSMRAELPHSLDETMVMEITPYPSEARLSLSIDGGRVSMSLEEFDRIADQVMKYRMALEVMSARAKVS